MPRPIPPKNNPFKDALAELKLKLADENPKKIESQKPEIEKKVNNLEFAKNQNSNPKKQKNKISRSTQKFLDIDQIKEKFIKKVLNSDYDGPPLVFRKDAQVTKINTTATSSSLKLRDLDKWKIVKFPDSPIKFSWIKSKKDTNYHLDYSKGEQFQPSRYSEDDIREIAIGLDFGTSSSKITIRDRQAANSFAIPFGKNQGIEDYLFPSKIFLNNNTFNLKEDGTELSNLKINIMSSSPSETYKLATIAYLALLIRHSRTIFFKNYDKNYINQQFLWRLNVGIPARTVQKFEIKDRILNICRAALICSFGNSEIVSVDEAKSALNSINLDNLKKEFATFPEELRLAFGETEDLFIEEGVNIYPEIMAQVHGFVHSNAWNPERHPNIMMIDIGAGTLDISLCAVVKGEDSTYYYYPLACLVEGLGVSNFVRSRLDTVLQAAETLPDGEQDIVLASLLQLDDINYGKIEVPTDLNQMFERFEFSSTDSKLDFDQSFKSKLTPCFWSKTTFEVAKAFLPDDPRWKPFPVFLCGGGARMSYYKKIISFWEDLKTARAQFDIRKLPVPTDLFNIDLNGLDYDRLSVAYGLGYWDLGKFLADYENPRLNVVGDESPKWSDNFISKDST